MRVYPLSMFGVSSSSGSRDSRGRYMPPPSKAGNCRTLSSGLVYVFMLRCPHSWPKVNGLVSREQKP